MKRLSRRTITKRQQQGRKDASKRKYMRIYMRGRVSGIRYATARINESIQGILT